MSSYSKNLQEAIDHGRTTYDLGASHGRESERNAIIQMILSGEFETGMSVAYELIEITKKEAKGGSDE